MKKLLLVWSLNAIAAAVLAQGTINSVNTSGTLFRTNTLAYGPGLGTVGNIAPTPGGFYFEVLTAPSTVTSVDLSLQEVLSAPWSDTGVRMTNTTLASGGRISGGAMEVANNWPAFQMNSFIVVGWSANEGTTWAQAAAHLYGADFVTDVDGSHFEGPNLASGGFIGATTVQQAEAGGPTGIGAFDLFGTAGSAAGTPITTPTDLYVIFAPEPSAMAVVGFGLAMFVLRRKLMSGA